MKSIPNNITHIIFSKLIFCVLSSHKSNNLHAYHTCVYVRFVTWIYQISICPIWHAMGKWSQNNGSLTTFIYWNTAVYFTDHITQHNNNMVYKSSFIHDSNPFPLLSDHIIRPRSFVFFAEFASLEMMHVTWI